MKKLAFALALLLILAAGTYWSGGGSGNSGNAVGKGPNPLENEKPGSGTIIKVTGLVERPYNLTYDKLTALPSRNVTAVLYCVDAPRTPRKNGTWTGVPLKILLERAGVKNGAYKIALYANDGYTTDLFVQWVLDNNNVIVAYKFNGEPITPRLVVPGMWGYKWIKGLKEIRLVDYDFKGTWERVGYPDYAYTDTEGPKGAR